MEPLENRALLAVGALDLTFGHDGIAEANFGGGFDYHLDNVALQADGKIILAGYRYYQFPHYEHDNPTTGFYDFVVSRFNNDGTLDATFNGGVIVTDFGASSASGVDDFAASVAVQDEGKIVVAGYSVFDSGTTAVRSECAIARYNSDGSLDTSFGRDGKVTTHFGRFVEITSLAIQADGKILVAGFEPAGFAVARFNTDGSFDLSFDVDGKQTTAFSSFSDLAQSIALQNDGKIIVAGTSSEWSQPGAFAIARYNADGTLDATFDGDGRQTVKFDSLDASVSSVAVSATGKIIVVGTVWSASRGLDVAIARLNGNGALDTKFDQDGKQTIDFGSQSDLAKGIVAQSNGSVVVVGSKDGEFELIHLDQNGSLASTSMRAGLPTEACGDMVVQSDGNYVTASFRVEDGNVIPFLERHVGFPTGTATFALPPRGVTGLVYFIDGKLHLRRPRSTADIVSPIDTQNLAAVQFRGSHYADRLTLDRSVADFQGLITFHSNGGDDWMDARAANLDMTFNGGDGNDTFLGGGGDDAVDGGSGNDNLSGGGGADSLSGGDGKDRMSGDAGNDVLVGGANNDTLNGGKGFDTLLSDAGKDVLDGGIGDDVLDGGDDNDLLLGSDGDDAIRGGSGNDTLRGGNGDDLLTGSAGNDSLLGDSGSDSLLGDMGIDTLKGGSGSDTINGVVTDPAKDKISDSTTVLDASFAFDFDVLLSYLV